MACCELETKAQRELRYPGVARQGRDLSGCAAADIAAGLPELKVRALTAQRKLA